MRDHDDSNGIWAETVRIMRSNATDEALQLPNSIAHSGVTTNLSRFLQKLELCTVENPEILHDHLKQPKLKLKDLELIQIPGRLLRLLYLLSRGY